MKAVLKREIGSYYKSITGWLFAAFLLVFVGIYCMVYNLSGYTSKFEQVLSAISFIYMIAVPIISMRVLAEERRQKTDQLLYSLPINLSGIVIGKYLGLLVVLSVPMLISAFVSVDPVAVRNDPIFLGLWIPVCIFPFGGLPFVHRNVHFIRYGKSDSCCCDHVDHHAFPVFYERTRILCSGRCFSISDRFDAADSDLCRDIACTGKECDYQHSDSSDWLRRFVFMVCRQQTLLFRSFCEYDEIYQRF